MSTYFKLSEEERKAILESMIINRKMGFMDLEASNPSAEVILREVASYYGDQELCWESEGLTESKQMAIYLARKLTSLSLAEIGNLVNAGRPQVNDTIRAMESGLKNGDRKMETVVKAIMEKVRLHYE